MRGNLVQGGGSGAEGTLLTTINALDPIYFTFDASEALFLKARRARESGAAPSDVRDPAAGRDRLSLARAARFRRQRPRSRVRERSACGRWFANADQFLTPGMFGNMRLSTGAGDAKRCSCQIRRCRPTRRARSCWSSAKDGNVAPRPVRLGPLIDGLRVVRSGLTPADRVVISGTQLVMPGVKVQVRPGKIVPQTFAAAPDTVAVPLSGEATFAGR